MISLKNQMNEIVDELTSLESIDAVAIARRDGILMASNFPQHNLPREVFAMMSATILGAAKNITMKSDMGLPQRVVIDTQDGNFVFMGAGRKALLVCLLKDGVKVQSVFETLDSACERIKDLM